MAKTWWLSFMQVNQRRVVYLTFVVLSATISPLPLRESSDHHDFVT